MAGLEGRYRKNAPTVLTPAPEARIVAWTRKPQATGATQWSTRTLAAVVFCLDEKTAIQALDRVDPRLPLSPGRAERHGFAYTRHGTLSRYAALNTQTGEVLGQTTARHISADSGISDGGRRLAT